jgi:hypothetical protein
MLREALEWVLTPCTTPGRRMGHLAESIAIAARARRCRTAWAPHLKACREALLASIAACPQRRVALVLGSGPLLDLPLTQLSRHFESVWLVDLVHPLSARWQARRLANVRLIEHDVTACLGDLSVGSAPDLDGLARRLPGRFLDEPRIDWVVSLNLVSQLPRLPLRWLGMRFASLADVSRQEFALALMRNHLAYLRRFDAAVCLIADLEQTTLAADGSLLEHTDLRPLLRDWKVDAEWRWDVAPTGEMRGSISSWHRVAALRPGGFRG